MKLRISDFGSNGGTSTMLYTPTPFVMATSPQYSSASSSFFAFFRKQKLWICGSRKSSLKAPLPSLYSGFRYARFQRESVFPSRRGKCANPLQCAVPSSKDEHFVFAKNIIFNKKILLRKNFFSQDSRCQILYSHCKNLHYAWDLHRQ